MRTRTLLIVGFLLFESCGFKKPKPDQTQPYQFDVLGEKILYSDSSDQNHLSSPDYVKVLFETNDSSQAVKMIADSNWTSALILNMKGYHYSEKNSKFIVYQKDSNKNGIKLYKIRPANFEKDSFATQDDIRSLYNKYNATEIDSPSNIFIIETRTLYKDARPFVRLICFNKNRQREKGITYNDFSETSVHLTENGYLFGLKSPEVISLYKDYVPSYKLIYIDFNHNILWTRESIDNSSRLVRINGGYKEPFTIEIEQPLGCTECESEFLKYTMKLELSGELSEIVITKQPQGQEIRESTLLSRLSQKK